MISVTVRRKARSLRKALQYWGCDAIDRRVGAHSASEATAGRMVLIVGPPRSGTTILYQLLASLTEASYVSNAMNLFPRSIVTLRRSFALDQRRYTGSKSKYGETAGWAGPSEGGRFWREFSPLAMLEDPVLKAGMAASFERGRGRCDVTVAKYLPFAFELEDWGRLFPDVTVLAVQRAIPAIALSIEKMRKAHYGTINRWMSVAPPGVVRAASEMTREEAEIGILTQVVQTAAAINGAKDSLGTDRFFEVSYEALLENPGQVVRGITDRLGIRVSDEVDWSAFVRPPRVSSEDRSRMERYESLLLAGHGR
jgi:hypothetical protein